MPATPPERPECPNKPGGRKPLPDPVALPDLAAPDLAAPDLAAPDLAAPDLAAPDLAAPDLAAVRLCRIPDPAPPYDGEAAQGSGLSAAAHEPGGHTAHGGHSAQPIPAHSAPAQRAGTAQAPPPGWPSRFAQVLAETLAGTRPPGQITPWTTEMARAHIQRLGPQLASGQQPRVRRVVTFHPTADVMEMTVVVGFGPRVRALAVRLERASPHPRFGDRAPAAPRWLCTAVEAA
jgi:hypothetical protein